MHYAAPFFTRPLRLGGHYPPSGRRQGARTIGFAILALPIGLVAFVPLFGVLFGGPEITRWSTGDFAAAGITLTVYLVAGAVFGYFCRRLWIVAGLLTWPCVGLSLYNLVAGASDPMVRQAMPVALAVLVVPLAVALLGGYAGARFRGASSNALA